MTDFPDDYLRFRLSRTSNVWAILTPSVHDAATPTWQLELSALGRGTKILAIFLKTSASKPLATVTIKGEAYALLITKFEQKRGIVTLGGERKIGTDGERLTWEMRLKHSASGEIECELRLKTTGKRRDGTVALTLPIALHQPEMWEFNAAKKRGHRAQIVWSSYNRHAAAFACLESDDEKMGWNDETKAFQASWRGFPLGGGKPIKFGLNLGASAGIEASRSSLVSLYAAIAADVLPTRKPVTPLDARPAVAAFLSPGSHVVKGAERAYLKSPHLDDDGFYAGFPYFPADALHALSQWNACRPDERIVRLIRSGARGIAADFQVMGNAEGAEPNKGAFWDRLSFDGKMTDGFGDLTHGISSNARLARSFFLLNDGLSEPLLRQSAINICQWLLLKQNAEGWFDGARVHATRGFSDDGRFVPDAETLDGADVLRAFVLAFRATGMEVWIKAAWKIADFLIHTRLNAFDAKSPESVASVLLGLRALDAESPNVRLRDALKSWGDFLRVLPLPESPDALFDVARAGFEMHAFDGNLDYLRLAFDALGAVSDDVKTAAWQSISLRPLALLALAARLPGASIDFDSLSVTMGWRVFSPDPATHEFLRVQSPGGEPIDFLPLVCRLNDQMLLIVLASPDVESVCVLKNGRRPLLRDLTTDSLDSDAPLHLVSRDIPARLGLFTLDP